MHEYQETTTKDLCAKVTGPLARQSSGLMPLDALYGYWGDELDIGIATPKRDIEQEFQSYVTSPPTPKVNILNFWEVSGENYRYYYR